MSKLAQRLLVLLVALAVVPAAAVASQTYPDEAGDAPAGVADITGVQVSHTQAGAVTFRIRFANRTTLVGEDTVAVLIDGHAGSPDGNVEYGIMMLGDVPLAVVANLATEQALAAVPIDTSDGLAVTVQKAMIGNPSAELQFGVMSTGAEMTEATTELVPHSGFYRYSVAVTVTAVKVSARKPPKAGAVFALAPVTVVLNTDETVKPERVVAKARIKGRVLKALPNGTSWKIPKTARGQKLVVTVTASVQGSVKTQTLTLRVR